MRESMQSLWKTQKQCLLKLDVSVPCGPRHIPNRNAYILVYLTEIIASNWKLLKSLLTRIKNWCFLSAKYSTPMKRLK